MKKLNLDKTWELCLQMWRWIAKERGKGNSISVVSLKAEWLRKHGFKEDSVTNDCFFCEYAVKRDYDCENCPGSKVDRLFDCNGSDYDYFYKPIAFYKKLLALNKIRTAKK